MNNIVKYYKQEMRIRKYKNIYEIFLEQIEVDYYTFFNYLNFIEQNNIINLDIPEKQQVEIVISFDTAIEIILKALHNFSKEFYLEVKDLYDNGYIDAIINENKKEGNICFACVPEIKPYIFVNYSNTITDFFTLAHEIGHALHFLFSRKENTFFTIMPNDFFAETSAVFMELLAGHQLINNYDDISEKNYIKNMVLKNIHGNIFRQAMNTMFEIEIYKMNGMATEKDFVSTWENINKMFCNEYEYDQFHSYSFFLVPHFIVKPFFCFTYSFAQILAISMYDTYLTNKCIFVENYKIVLNLAGCRTNEELFTILNINYRSEEIWKKGIEYVKNYHNV